MATSYHFNTNGALAKTESGADKAYVQGHEVPYISGSNLVTFAAIVYSESASSGLVNQITGGRSADREMFRENFGMVQAMFNYSIAKNAALRKAGRGSYGLPQLLNDKDYAKGRGSAIFNEYFGTGGDQKRRQYATLAVLKLFTKNINDVRDIATSGIVGWDGKDLYTRYKEHYRFKVGLELGNPSHGHLYNPLGIQTIASQAATSPNVKGRQYTWQSVFTAGGSIFHRIHPQAAAQGISV